MSSQSFNPAAHSSAQVSLQRGWCGLVFQASLTTEGPREARSCQLISPCTPARRGVRSIPGPFPSVLSLVGTRHQGSFRTFVKVIIRVCLKCRFPGLPLGIRISRCRQGPRTLHSEPRCRSPEPTLMKCSSSCCLLTLLEALPTAAGFKKDTFGCFENHDQSFKVDHLESSQAPEGGVLNVGENSILLFFLAFK